jgi:gliding motility-associated-like protein
MTQKLYILVLCSFITYLSFGQATNLCTDPRYEPGGFTLSSPEICVGTALSTINQTTGTDIRYLFDYKGENITEASALAKGNTSYTYTVLNNFPSQPFQKEFTVLQMGNRAGKTFVACKKVIVRTSNEPIMSWDVCGLNRLDLAIPIHPLNDYDSYTIDLGIGIPVQTKTKADLPFKISQTLPVPSLPRNISITGRYNIRPSTCPNVKIIQVTNIAAFITRPYHANIDRLELLTKSKVELTFTGSYVSAPNDYTLYGYIRGQHLISPKPIQINNIVEGGKYQIDLPDPTKQYCFYAQRSRACVTTFQAIEKSIEICTHPIVSISSPAGLTTTSVTWNPYPNNVMFGVGQVNNNVQRYKRTRISDPPQPAEQQKAIGATFHLDQNSPTTTINNYDCKFKNCYQISMSLQGRIPGTQIPYKAISVSNTECSDRFNVVPPPISKLWAGAEFVTAGPPDENFKVDFLPNTVTPWAVPKNRWVLYRMESGIPIKLDSSSAVPPMGKPMVIDPRLPKESTEYKIGYVDRCESRSALSPSTHSVFLDQKGGSTIFWTKDSPFNFGGILYYEVVPLNDSTFVPLSNVKKVNKGTYQDIVNLGNPKDAAPFYVKIYSDSTLVSFVRSNITKIPIAINFFAPTAFSPNGDTVNDDFGIFGPKSKLDQYFFQIFDRFGGLVFETTDKNLNWDGLIKGKPAPAGTYSWKLTIRLKATGKIFKKSGTVNLFN